MQEPNPPRHDHVNWDLGSTGEQAAVRVGNRALGDAGSCSKPQRRGTGPLLRAAGPGAAAPAFPRAFQAKLPAGAYITPLLLGQAGGLYIGLSHFTPT